MASIVHSPAGVVHLAAAGIALLLGTVVLLAPKGTKSHIRLGYAYVLSMLVLNATAFLIYHLWGRFGVFHWFAVLSLATLSAGMLPLLLHRSAYTVQLHVSFMYWSVFGLYAAFVSETIVRVPGLIFYKNLGASVGVSTTVVMVAGGIIFGLTKQRWMRFGQYLVSASYRR
jgi:uncharacterized membrane protein